MIYFDNAATGGRKPDCVLSATTAALKVCANPGRSGHKLALSLGKIVRNCRRVLNDFFDGYDDERVIFTKNCTEALNIALFGVLKPGDHVVVSAMEHNSVLRPLEQLKALGVIEYDGRRETAYSSNTLYHYRTSEWTADEQGFYHDSEGRYVVAASDMEQGTVFQGSMGECIVLDSGCDAGVTDYYTNWR